MKSLRTRALISFSPTNFGNPPQDRKNRTGNLFVSLHSQTIARITTSCFIFRKISNFHKYYTYSFRDHKIIRLFIELPNIFLSRKTWFYYPRSLNSGKSSAFAHFQEIYRFCSIMNPFVNFITDCIFLKFLHSWKYFPVSINSGKLSINQFL